MSTRSILVAIVLLGFNTSGNTADRLAVHEWGTFTAFQNEAGEALRRINTDDEPVPEFVHQLVKIPQDVKLYPPTEMVLGHQQFSQGATPADLRVTMRLETPVLYFHLPPGLSSMTLDVEVGFQRGFLTQFFPQAAATVNGQPPKQTEFPQGQPIESALKWFGVRLGQAGSPPQTTDPVWLAPRNVKSAAVTVDGESEQFLFYRGVGTLESPLRVIRHPDQLLEVRINPSALQSINGSSAANDRTAWQQMALRRSWWFVEVRPDGRVAYRQPRPHFDGDAHQLSMIAGTFSDEEFSEDHLSELQSDMRKALIGDGLNTDEADALLNTWQLSYFRSPGQRLFYLVPRHWTDAVIPLRLSVPTDIARVMVGRVELVTPRHRELIQQMSRSTTPDLTNLLQQMNSLQHNASQREAYNALASGRGDTSILQGPVTPIYQAFLDLGRFRTPLLLDALQREKQAGTDRLARIRQFQFELLHPGKLKHE